MKTAAQMKLYSVAEKLIQSLPTAQITRKWYPRSFRKSL